MRYKKCEQRVRVTCEQSRFGPERQFSLVPDLSKNQNLWFLMGLLLGPDINPRSLARVLHAAEPYFHKLRTLAPIKHFSSDRITIWYIHKRCSFECSFTSNSPHGDPINICCTTAKHTQFLALFHSNSLNMDQITKWRIEVESGWKSASSTYISYCRTIWTQILHWSQSFQFATLWNPAKNYAVSGVKFFDWVQPIPTVPVWFQPRPGTEPWIWNRC